MACYHPLTGYVLGKNPKTGKNILKIVGKNFDGEEYASALRDAQKISIPCGKCKGCRLEYSRQWALRCMLELQAHEKACFLTLTYNDEHLPKPNTYVDETGHIVSSPVHPLKYDDVQKFLKKLRQVYYPWKVRFFMCGEYGPLHMRPHYHLILFGIDLTEFDAYIEYGTSKAGDVVSKTYVSSIVDALWRDVKPSEKSNPEVYDDPRRSLGFHTIGSVTYESCAYVSRYIFKKQLGFGASVYDELHYPPEFCNMSRRPGIGRVYYDLCKEDIYKTEEVFISTKKGGRKFKPPRYYDRLYDIDYPEDSEVLKERRHKLAVAKNRLRKQNTSKSYLDQLATDEFVLSERLKKFQRKEGIINEKKDEKEERQEDL